MEKERKRNQSGETTNVKVLCLEIWYKGYFPVIFVFVVPRPPSELRLPKLTQLTHFPDLGRSGFAQFRSMVLGRGSWLVTVN